MKKPKPKILLCWGYHRKGWVKVFNSLSDHFDFSYIFYISKPNDEINFAEKSSIYYWKDFANAQDIINKINPGKIVFMGIEGSNTIALNITAKNLGIETLYLQHGMFHKFSDYVKWAEVEDAERNEKKEFNESAQEVDRYFLLLFFLRTVLFVKPLALIYIFRLQNLKRKFPEILALKKLPSKYRKASKYVVFTKDNASIFYERDSVDENDVIEIGNFEMDSFFKGEKQDLNPFEKYFLLIDEPWSEVKEYASPGFGISKDQTNDFYKKLSEFAKRNSAKLKIKLHPYSYASDFFVSDPNIEYLKETDIVDLILKSEAVFGFSSTLMLPAIYYKKCCLFNLWQEMSFQQDMKDLDIVQVLDYRNFTIDDIDFEKVNKSNQNLELFVKKYLFKTDGKAAERLKEILQK